MTAKISVPSRVATPKRGLLMRLYRSLIGDIGLTATLVRVTLLFVLALFFGLPLLWLLLAPTKIDPQLVSEPPLSIGDFGNYLTAWRHLTSYNDGQVFVWANNSLIYTLGSLLLSLAAAIPAGYALATSRFAGRSLILWLTLITMILPSSALVLPLFLEMNAVGLVDTPWAVILPAAFFPFGVYLTYVFYSTSMPPDLLAAARVDGCSEWQLFQYIALPLARTLLGLLAFLSFTGNWNNYFLPFVMLNDESLYNLPLGLKALVTGTPALNPTFAATDTVIKRPEAALMGVLMVLPVAVVFIFSQRFVVSGALTGATRE